MNKLPKKFCDRVHSRLKHYQTIAASHRTRDVSEADTVTLVKDILADIFGYDKYAELTSEQQIRGTFCDLAIQLDGKIRFLIEVKGAGSSLTEGHLRQAVNYGAHQGVEWIILTNAVEWRFYKITFGQPIEYDEITRFILADLNARSEDDLQKLFLLAREGLPVDAITAFHQLQQVVNQYTIAQLLIADPVVALVRKEMRRLFPDLKIDGDAIRDLMTTKVLKRDSFDCEKAEEAKHRLRKASQKLERAAKKASIAAAA